MIIVSVTYTCSTVRKYRAETDERVSAIHHHLKTNQSWDDEEPKILRALAACLEVSAEEFRLETLDPTIHDDPLPRHHGPSRTRPRQLSAVS